MKAACAAVNDAISGTYADPNTTSGISSHSTGGSTPTRLISRAPSRKPIPVPITARHTRVPVVSALERSTDRAPSTTQKPCSTGNTCVTATASASPSPVRRLLRTATARLVTNPDAIWAATFVSGSSRSDAPVGGSRRPSARAHTGRASAAAAAAMIRPVAPIVAAMVRRRSSSRPSRTAWSSSTAPRMVCRSSR